MGCGEGVGRGACLVAGVVVRSARQSVLAQRHVRFDLHRVAEGALLTRAERLAVLERRQSGHELVAIVKLANRVCGPGRMRAHGAEAASGRWMAMRGRALALHLARG